MGGTSGYATGEAHLRVLFKRKRDFADFMDLGLLCVHSVVADVVLVASAVLNECSNLISSVHDSYLRWKELHMFVLSIFGENPHRSLLAIPRVRSAIDNLRAWKYMGLSIGPIEWKDFYSTVYERASADSTYCLLSWRSIR
jgi:hypothetical protein